MEIDAILPATPPAIAPAFELCPPIGVGVAEFEEESWDNEELETPVGPVEVETPDGPGIVPGPSSGVSKEVRCRCETVTGDGGGFSPPTAYDLLKFQLFSYWGVL